MIRARTHMTRLRHLDSILQNEQGQGRISFFMTRGGEEAFHFAAASTLPVEDTVLARYGKAGVLMWRDFTLQQFADTCFSNKSDLGKARKIPVDSSFWFPSPELSNNFQSTRDSTATRRRSCKLIQTRAKLERYNCLL